MAPLKRRPNAGLILTLAAVVGLALGAASQVWDGEWRTVARKQGAKLMTRNDDLMYGLKRAMETVQACNAKGIEVGTITIQGPEPTFTTAGTPGTGTSPAPAGPSLPFGARKGGR
jgi:hypothetical protein